MSISSETRKAGPFTGNGVTTAFPFAFKVFTEGDVRVVRTSLLGIESDLVLNSDYTVSLNGNQDANPGGTVTLSAALADDLLLTLTSKVQNLQPLALTNAGGFFPAVLNTAFDRAVILVQQLSEGLGRSLKVPISSTASPTLPAPEANSVLAWNEDADGFVNVPASDLATVAAYGDSRVETFTGDGTETDFELDFHPGTVANADVSIDGVVQVAGIDFTRVGQTLVFTAAPPASSVIAVRYTRPLVPGPDAEALLSAVDDAEAAQAAAEAAQAAAEAALGLSLLKSQNLADLASASTARTNLGVAIGTNVQAYNARLQDISTNLTATSGTVEKTGANTFGTYTVTTAGKALLDDADAPAQRTTLGLVIGTDVQAQDADLQAIANLTSAADKVPYATGAGTWAMADLTSFARTLLATVSNSAFLTALGQIASTFVDFVNAGTGAVTRTLQGRLRDTVSVLDFIPVAEHAAILAGTSTYDATAGIQAAINTGRSVEFPDGRYNAAGLTVSTNRQRLLGTGSALVYKNANGSILSSSAIGIELNGLSFRGESATYTGDNISLTGNSPRLINCGSRDAEGRALKSTGNNLQVYGTCDIYQTADATSAGYDIEVGVSGTSTLYHELHGIYSSQATGGILFVDCGSQTIVGGEFGKLNISAGTTPAGANGGKCLGARVLGDVTVNQANGVFIGNQFSSITFTIGTGIAETVYYGNSEANGFSLVNNGSVNQNILRWDRAGTGGFITYQYGPTASSAKLQVDPSNGDQYLLNGNLYLPASKNVYLGGTGKGIASASTNLQVINNDGAVQLISAAQVQLVVGGNVYGTVNTTGFLLPAGAALYNNSIKVVGAQGAAVANATGGVVIDAEARTAINDLLARLRTHGLIAT